MSCQSLSDDKLLREIAGELEIEDKRNRLYRRFECVVLGALCGWLLWLLWNGWWAVRVAS